MTYEELQNKYPGMNREQMPPEKERQFVNDCFLAYETEGFAAKFWSLFDQYKDRIGLPFTVQRRTEEEKDRVDLMTLPSWQIRFPNGDVITVYPEEIIHSEMCRNGCPANIFAAAK